MDPFSDMSICKRITLLFNKEDTEAKRMANRQKTPDLNLVSIVEGMSLLYSSRVLPMERHYLFEEFHSPPLEAADFAAKPTVLMVGQYSTGKTTFIRYLLERDYPGIRIGPEPTTDRFIAVMHNKKEGTIPGNALVIDADKQFRPLAKFGNSFLNRLQISECDSPVLEGVTFVDTPGILSGEKQRVDRGYDFPGVLKWFAERVDRIVLMFDANKLDISDEMEGAIEALSRYDHKMRIILNKSDGVSKKQLIRVYGALMWSLAKVLRSPEAVRIYIGSFWEKPFTNEQNEDLFEEEERELLQDLRSLPKESKLRILNDLIQRARLVRVHALIVCTLKDRMPVIFNSGHKQQNLVKQLPEIYSYVRNTYGIPLGDFPDMKSMQKKLKNFDLKRFNGYDKQLFDSLNRVLNELAPKLMAHIVAEQRTLKPEQSFLRGGKFEISLGDGFDDSDDKEWDVDKHREDVAKHFNEVLARNEFVRKISFESFIKEMNEREDPELPNTVLDRICQLSDVDRDGFLDEDEYALAMYLTKMRQNGHQLPTELPAHLIPASKRRKVVS